MSTVCEFELNGKQEVFEFGKVAKQANGSVLAKIGNAVVLATEGLVVGLSNFFT